MFLWLDDVRDPEKYGHLRKDGWVWAQTADEAIYWLRKKEVESASLDHDLTFDQMSRGGYYGQIHEDGMKSGYDVVKWLEEHPEYWPPRGVHVHSANPAGKARMEQVILRHYGQNF